MASASIGLKRKLVSLKNDLEDSMKKRKIAASSAKRKLYNNEDAPPKKIQKTVPNRIQYTKDYIPVRTVQVVGLDKQLVKKDVLQYFNSFGRVKCAIYSDVGKQSYKTANDNAAHREWYVTYSDAADAFRALNEKDHQKLSENIRVLAADSWFQEDCPNKQNRLAALAAQREDPETLTSSGDEASVKSQAKITDLNEDCLTHILLYVSYDDLVAVADTCTQFNIPAHRAFKAKYKNPRSQIEFYSADLVVLGKYLTIFGEHVTQMSLTDRTFPDMEEEEHNLKVNYNYNLMNHNCENLTLLIWSHTNSSFHFDVFKKRQLSRLVVNCKKGSFLAVKIVNHFGCTKSLKHLTITKGNGSVELIKRLAEFKNLRTLELLDMENIPSAKYFTGLKSLTELRIGHTKYIKKAEDLLTLVAGLPNLIALKIPMEAHFITRKVYMDLVDIARQRSSPVTLSVQSVWHPVIPQQVKAEYSRFVELQGYIQDDGQLL